MISEIQTTPKQSKNDEVKKVFLEKKKTTTQNLIDIPREIPHNPEFIQHHLAETQVEKGNLALLAELKIRLHTHSILFWEEIIKSEKEEMMEMDTQISYKIGGKGQLTLVYKGTELELFKGGKGFEEFDWFVYQVLDNYGEEFVEKIRGKDLYRITDQERFYRQCCEDVVACAVELNTHFQAQTSDHCKWFLYEPHFRPYGGSHSWLIHKMACVLILANDKLFTASGYFRGNICELDPLWKEEEGFYSE